MLGRGPFLRVGTGIALIGSAALLACGGEEFTPQDPTTALDGSLDTKPPSDDRNMGSDRAGAGGSGASGGTSGKGGSNSGGAGGAGSPGGTGGAGAMSGSGGAGGLAGGKSGVDGGKSDGPSADGPGISDDASSDRDGLVTIDGWTGDGAPVDADSGRSGDASDVGTSDASLGDASDGNAVTDTSRDNRIDAAVGDVACGEPVTYYKDEDGDGFGKNSETLLSCGSPGTKWSLLGGDCRDDLANVKPYSVGSPNPPVYSATGYADASKPGGVSFDYDCTGAEEADPSNPYGADFDCSLLVNCKGAGYLPVNPARTGPGIDPRCGSTTLQRCTGTLVCSSTTEATMVPYRCR